MLTMHCTGIWASGLQAGGGEKDGLQKPGGWIYTQTGTVVQYLVTTETRPRALFLINERLSASAPKSCRSTLCTSIEHQINAVHPRSRCSGFAASSVCSTHLRHASF